MTLTFECPNCHDIVRTEFSLDQSAVPCPGCSGSTSVRQETVQGTRVKECALCGTEDLYVQKDFPRGLGLFIVVMGAVLSSVAWWQYWYPAALGILLAAAALDMCLYYLIGDVLICYRCSAQYRGVERSVAHQPFDLGLGERYRQERLRLVLLRQKQGQGPPEESNA